MLRGSKSLSCRDLPADSGSGEDGDLRIGENRPATKALARFCSQHLRPTPLMNPPNVAVDAYGLTVRGSGARVLPAQLTGVYPLLNLADLLGPLRGVGLAHFRANGYAGKSHAITKHPVPQGSQIFRLCRFQPVVRDVYTVRLQVDSLLNEIVHGHRARFEILEIGLAATSGEESRLFVRRRRREGTCRCADWRCCGHDDGSRASGSQKFTAQ